MTSLMYNTTLTYSKKILFFNHEYLNMTKYYKNISFNIIKKIQRGKKLKMKNIELTYTKSFFKKKYFIMKISNKDFDVILKFGGYNVYLAHININEIIIYINMICNRYFFKNVKNINIKDIKINTIPFKLKIKNNNLSNENIRKIKNNDLYMLLTSILKYSKKCEFCESRSSTNKMCLCGNYNIYDKYNSNNIKKFNFFISRYYKYLSNKKHNVNIFFTHEKLEKIIE